MICPHCGNELTTGRTWVYCERCTYTHKDAPKPKTITRRVAPELTADEHDQIAGLLRDYANRLQRERPSKFDAINADREQRIRAARFLAETINRTSRETTTYTEDGRVQCVSRFSRPDAPPGRVPSEYTGGNQASDIAIQRDLK